MNLKKFSLIALIAAMSSTAFGASIDHIQNYTAEYNANPAQQAAISATTSPFFNPAGLMRLPNGTYFTGGLQMALGEEKMKYGGEEYSADLAAPIPNFAIFKKTDDRTYFWTFSGIAGGGDLEYKDGVAGIAVLEDALPALPMGKNLGVINGLDTHGSWAEGENMYGQTTIGMAWNVTNKLSMSVGARAVYGWRKLEAELNAKADRIAMVDSSTMKPTGNYLTDVKAHAYMDAERTAWGFGGQIGLNYAANDTWNFAMRYDSKVRMTFESDASSKEVTINGKINGQIPTEIAPGLGFEDFFPQYKDGSKYRRDLPAILALGASQKVTDRWTMFYGFNYYFNESARIDKDVNYSLPGGLSNEVKDMEYDNGWEISIGTEYWINDKFAILGGANYADTGAPEDSYSDVEYALNSFMVGLGVKYRPDEDTEWVVATNHYFYESTDGNFSKKYTAPGVSNQRYDKDITSIGFSYTKRF